MILNLGSLAFNADIKTGGGTPAWGTELGQGEGYKFVFEDMSDFFTGMVYKSISDIDNVTCPLGKGGNQRADYEFVIASIFDKIFVNGRRVKDARFLLLVVKKIKGDHHVGRRTIKYNPRMTYCGELINEDCYKKMVSTLGFPEDAAWFVHEILIKNQDELHFTAYVLGQEPQSYSSNDERRNAFISKLPKEGKLENNISPQSNQPLQQIFYGAPGTGKSNTIKRDTEVAEKEGRVFRTTFHPDSDYSTFVGCYKPSMKSSEKVYTQEELIAKLEEIKNTGTTYPCHKFSAKYWRSLKDLSTENTKKILSACGFTDSMTTEILKGVSIGQEYLNDAEDGTIVYTFTPQAFTNAYVKAWNTTEDVYLIIEEINRGNCAQIFGDLFQLLDRKDGVSEYPIDADTDLRNYLSTELAKSTRDDFPEGVKEGKKLVLPKNLYIWATMNTSDQSLFPIDSAFKRRWDWKYIPINTQKEKWFIDAENVKYSWTAFLERINNIINEKTSSEDKQLGFYFCKAKGDTIDAETFVSKVVFYLWNDVFKDYGFDGEYFADPEGGTLEFRKFFNFDGTINEKKVTAFLKNIKIEADNNKSDDSRNDEITEDKVE